MTDREHDTAAEHARHGDRVERREREAQSDPRPHDEHALPEKVDELQVRNLKSGDVVEVSTLAAEFARTPAFEKRWRDAGSPDHLTVVSHGGAHGDDDTITFNVGGDSLGVALPREASVRAGRR